MKVFNKQVSPSKILLCASLIINVAFVGIFYKYENRSHLLIRKLENWGIVQKKDNFYGRPDYWSVQGWNSTIKKLDIQCDVMFFGHSQIEMSDFRKYFPGVNIVTSGYPGDNVEGMRMRVEQIGALKPSKVFLMCGINSLGMSDNDFEAKYDLLVKDIKNASPRSELYIFNILPECDGKLGKASQNIKIVKRNDFIKKYALCNNISLIDLYSLYADKDGTLFKDVTTDGVHLTPQGYDRWAKAIEPLMRFEHR